MKRNIQRLFSCADAALDPVELGGDPEEAKQILQEILDSDEANEEDKANAREMMHMAINAAADAMYNL